MIAAFLRLPMLPVLFIAGAGLSVSAPAEVPMTQIPEIRRLTPAEAAQAIPVKIKGVCVWSDQGHFVVSDGEECIWVSIRYAMTGGLFPRDARKSDIKPGTGVEIDGVTNEGGYAPIIFPKSIKRTGKLPVPPPKRVQMDRILSGSEDGQWVELDAVVQEVFARPDGKISAAVIACGEHAWVHLTTGTLEEAGRLVDATVRLRGICAPDQNLRSEAISMKFFISGPGDLEVLRPPPPDPFQAPRVALNNLLPFSPDATPYNRKLVSGVVTFVVPGKLFFLQQGTTNVRVNSADAGVKVGDRVEASGFVDTSGLFASLRNVLVRVVGTDPIPPPLPVTVDDIVKTPVNRGIRDRKDEDLNGRRVTLRGTLHRVDWHAPDIPSVIWVESDGWTFPVGVPDRKTVDRKLSASWVPGSKVDVTGICELEFGGMRDAREDYRPKGFHLLLASPEDLRIVQSPPWWTPGRLVLALGCAVCAAIVLLLWTWILRRQVGRQTRIIGEKIRSEATQEERNRIARDLHDSIEQQLAGVSMHLFGAKSSLASNPESAAGALEQARRMLKHTQRETRTSIRELRSPLLEGHGLEGALRTLAADAHSSGEPRIDVEIADVTANLTPDREYQLLRLAQEALNNALKHSKARNIHIALGTASGETCLSVTDDGIGFRPGVPVDAESPHFGMIGMRERAARLGAKLEILSSPGNGCSVRVSLPHSAEPARP